MPKTIRNFIPWPVDRKGTIRRGFFYQKQYPYVCIKNEFQVAQKERFGEHS